MPDKNSIQIPSRRELWSIRLMVLLGGLSVINFFYWFLQEQFKSFALLYWLLIITLVYAILKMLYLWYHYISISIPKKQSANGKYTVDILTTYFPGEPYEMIEETLEAIQAITYPHTTYLCDEANDPHLIEFCRKLNVVHVTRDNRKDAKAGNINNALRKATGEICVVLDPDHVPEPHFLDPIIGHFNDPQIGFVQVVQAYYNIRETLVARGAAEQTFQFYGPMMMSMNSYGTVNAIGANCTFRRAALDSIGGHAPGLSEDMHTAMQLHAKGWKSVYVPEVLAKGLAPSDLTSFYKQQLKWSRGTFDLLFYVYPKLFKKFTWRQKIHYGLLPLHYLIGAIYLINFLIPILSLFLAKSPWNGNLIFFGIFALPLGMSGLLIRAYIQKWVIEKSERGFHLIGGLLQITTWWIYFLGFIYTIFKKKIPYLPTPKNGAEHSNFKIILPNVAIGLLSLTAIVYGLTADFTPFSIAMSFFALLNAFFMFFSIFLATRKINRNNILRTTLKKSTVAQLVKVKSWYRKLSDLIFRIVRPMAPLLLALVVFGSIFLQWEYQRRKWEEIPVKIHEDPSFHYLGIYHPLSKNGISDLTEIRRIEKKQQDRFDLISLYVAWGDTTVPGFPFEEIELILKEKRLPLITWEPWASTFKVSDSIPDLKNEKHIFKYISSGLFDAYILKIARYLKELEKPIFLRFGHEFDNPGYPWSSTGDNTPDDFKRAWKHIHNLFKMEGADKVAWIWNPWKSEKMPEYYPGDDYVDWVGITALNYGLYNEDGKWHHFDAIYKPFGHTLGSMTRKPVMLTEFGSLNLGGDQQQWMASAFQKIADSYPEINGVVLFNSAMDQNIPEVAGTSAHTLDWQLHSFPFPPAKYRQPLPDYFFTSSEVSIDSQLTKTVKTPFAISSFLGVKYKKGQQWFKNNYVLSRDVVQEDLGLLKRFGISHIHYTGGNIYDYNMLKQSEQLDVSIIYNFYIPSTIDYVNNYSLKNSLKENILKTIGQHKDRQTIVAWNLGNDVWDELSKLYNEPVLTYQRRACLLWIKELTSAIKDLDPTRPLTMDIHANSTSSRRISSLFAINLPVDSYGLVVKNESSLRNFMNFPINDSIPYFISDLPAGTFVNMRSELEGLPVILSNWQDEWESDKIRFDGILDFEGRKRMRYAELDLEGEFPEKMADTFVKILKPAILLYPGLNAQYHALLGNKHQWIYPDPQTDSLNFEWHLVKNDPYGNHLAIKKLGKGVSKEISIPSNANQYEIMVTYLKDNWTQSDRTALKTPLIQKDSIPMSGELSIH